MHGASAAEGDERELAGIVAALDRDDAQRLGHVAVDDFDDLGGRFGHSQSEQVCHSLADRRLGCREIDLERAAQQRLAIEVAQHDVGVADRGLPSAFAIGGRARVSPGAAWPDFERAAMIDPGDAAAAGADLGEVDDRHPDRMAGPM